MYSQGSYTIWYCAAKHCENKATQKIKISDNEFATVCDNCLSIYKHTMGGNYTTLTPTEPLLPGWEPIKYKHRWRGAHKRGYERKK